MNNGYFINFRSGMLPKQQEADIDTCGHCGKVLFLNKVPGTTYWPEDGGFCRVEMKRLCGPCATRALTHGCESMVRTIERQHSEAVKLEQHLKIAGLEPPAPRPLIIAGG